MKNQSLLFVMAILFGLLSCQSSNESANLLEIKAELEVVCDSYYNAIKTVNVDSVTAFWTDDLQIYSKSFGEISGIEAFRELLESAYTGLEIPEIRVISREIDVSVNLAIEVTEYSEILIKDGGDPQHKNGKSLTVWKKIDNGWKINKMVSLPSGKVEIKD